MGHVKKVLVLFGLMVPVLGGLAVVVATCYGVAWAIENDKPDLCVFLGIAGTCGGIAVVACLVAIVGLVIKPLEVE